MEPQKELTLRPVGSGGLRQEVSDILREAIWSGALKPGQRLNEQWLASELGVSRPPIREAIRVLEREGLLVSLPRRGTFVRTLSSEDIFEIYFARCALEGAAAELLMEVASPGDLDLLDGLIDEVEARSADGPRWVIDDDLKFHRAMVELSRNSLLLWMWDQLAGQLRLALTLVEPSFVRADYVELTHRPLVDAVRDKDVEETRRLVRTLLDVGRSLSSRWEETTGHPDIQMGTRQPKQSS